MKSQTRTSVFAVIVGTFLTTPYFLIADDRAEALARARAAAEARMAAENSARARDPAWKPECDEISLVQVGDSTKPGSLTNFCLDNDGNILACFSPKPAKRTEQSTEPGEIRVYSPKGELQKTLPLKIRPSAIAVAKDRTIFVAGEGRIVKLDAKGKELASAPSPVASEPILFTKETEEMIVQTAARTKRSVDDEKVRMKANLERRRAEVTGLTVAPGAVLIAVGSPTDFTYRVYRLDHSLQNPTLVVEKLRGCCGQMDIQSHEDTLLIPHNTRHTVEFRDFDGKQTSKFGKKGKMKADEFGGCCEPKNLRVLESGDILAAESGPPTCIKRFSADGKFKGVVAVVPNTKGDCVRVTVAANADESRFYMMDTTRDAIRVFAKR